MLNSFVFLVTLIANLNNPVSSGLSDVNVTSRSISLENRYNNEFVNGVFRDNILLTLKYLDEDVVEKSQINWAEVTKPDSFVFSLNPNESFAFHDQLLPKYEGKVVKTTNAHFNFTDGFKSSGYLMGDGVCHLASLIYWAAKDAGLDTYVPTNHNFANINEVPKEYGVSIYSLPGNNAVGANQNLYITNNLDTKVNFIINYDGEKLTTSVVKGTNLN